MKFNFLDSVALQLNDKDKVRMTPDGYLVASPRVARTGIQLYKGSEIGMTGDDANKIFKIFRPEEQVFDQDSMRSFAHKPITDDHPSVPVNSTNWRQFSRGQIGDEIARDGEFVRVPMVLMDHGLIKKVQEGKAELSVGYAADIIMDKGISPTGEAYDGYQSTIRVNHTAVVDAGRAGSSARIGDGSGDVRLDVTGYAAAMAAAVAGKAKGDGIVADSGYLGRDKRYPVLKDGVIDVAATRAVITDSIAKGDGDVTAAARSLLAIVDTQPEAKPPIKETKMTKHVVDGISVEMDDTAIQVVDKTIKGLRDTIESLKATAASVTADHNKIVADKDAQIAKLTTDFTAATTKVTTLETQLKDATVTPEKLETMVVDRQTLIAKAKVLLPAVVTDGKTDGDIRKQVVDAKVGAATKDWSADQVKTSFDTLAASITDEQLRSAAGGHTIRDMGAAFVQPNNGGASIYDKRDQQLEAAWKGTPAGQA